MKAIGRSAETKVEAGSWEDLWKLNGAILKEKGLEVRDRRSVHDISHALIVLKRVKIYSLVHGEVPQRYEDPRFRTRT